MLTTSEKEFLIQLLEQDQNIPEDFKYKLFPTEHKEYELAYAGKMRKEDLLANDDGSFPVPLQVERLFNGTEHPSFEDGWCNLIVFGDNLQLLKTIYKNEDPLIKDKVKGKVKLIYIDPPFATLDEFQNKDKAKAYNDKKKGADFVEWLRRRLIIAREILSDDGSIFLHLDQKMCHYARTIMDEIFGSNCFQNQVIWQCTSAHNDAKKKYGNIHQIIYWYGKNGTPNYYYDSVRDSISSSNLKEYSRIELADGTIIPYKGNEDLVCNGNRRFRTVDATWKGTSKQFVWRGVKPNPKREWMYTHDEMEAALKRGELFLADENKGAIRCLKRYLDENEGQILQDIWNNAGRMSGGKGTYPTEKPEALLKRIILSTTKPGDLVLDFFAGSGTTAAVAEKLGRKWITCDIGKLSFFTIQKRILQIQESKMLENETKKYGIRAKSFMTCSLGSYDLKAALEMEFNKYKEFVSGLFDVDLKTFKIGGYIFDGKKDDNPVIIYNYNQFKDSNIDDNFVQNVNKHIGNKMKGGRVYIVSPSTRVDFITDYEEVDETRYYFLKIPYQIIKELHQKDFKKFRQPQSKSNVNALDDSIGFSFNRTPTVNSTFRSTRDKVIITINSFASAEPRSAKTATEKDLNGFDLLSAVFIDKNYNGKEFIMTNSFFFEDMKVKNNKLVIELKKSAVGKKLMIVYTDIFGNDLTESFSI